ncbi:hypothetical protein GYA93_00805 [Gordonia desulfuricans]|uniref:Uncharacterized protein n=1 Tax=Gordonia desulfuricans TaxID=89051 RepID=A0A7K3LKQ8_9ACTN|nr:hypothetical protein [Gordonia desulfuricans]NDK88127.1 hypothetical protein [Gordonia desulfuricans]
MVATFGVVALVTRLSEVSTRLVAALLVGSTINGQWMIDGIVPVVSAAVLSLKLFVGSTINALLVIEGGRAGW